MVQENEILIRYSQSNDSKLRFFNGYSHSISGKRMSYHCFHPEANQALIARARTNENKISWMTDNFPRNTKDCCTFVWIAGICGSKSRSHKFDLLINGEYVLSLDTLVQIGQSQFPIIGIHGEILSFQSMMTDQFEDQFGWMFLTIDTDRYKEGFPLSLEWVGEEADSQDWLMVYEYALQGIPRLRCEPVIMKYENSIVQELTILIDHIATDSEISIDSLLENQTMKLIQFRINTIHIPIPAVSKPTELKVITFQNEDAITEESIWIQPVSPRTVHILSFSHNDIGYTELQEDVLRKQCKNIDDSLELIDSTLTFPEDSQYRWNLEVIWALEEWWNRASDDQRKRFSEAVKSGHIGLNALYTNPLTGLANEVELAHQLDYAIWFQKETGLNIQTSAVTDIPGFTWGLVTALDNAGVKYFSISPNSGDRVGHIYEGLGDKPFYWQSQDGSKQVLTWVAGAGYSMFHRERLSGSGIRKLMNYLTNIQDKQYPYDTVILPYTIGGDNGGPDVELPSFVKNWNDTYHSPKLVISTHQHFFESFENKYGNIIPTMKGDMTPYWEDGAFSTAADTAMNRQASIRLIQVETLARQLNCLEQVSERIKACWKNIVLYDEHTWGAWNSVSEPDDPKVIRQWQTKREFAVQAHDQSIDLLRELLQAHSQAKDSLTFINTCPWKRSGIVEIIGYPNLLSKSLSDEKGEAIPVQMISPSDFVAFLNLEANEQKTAFMTNTNGVSEIQQWMMMPILENNRCKIAIDEKVGCIKSLWVKLLGKEMIDSSDGFGLGQFLYVPGTDSSVTRTLQNVRLISLQQGTLFDILQIQADAPACQSFFLEIRLHHLEDRIDLHYKINKQAVRDKEGLHIAFPFSLPDGVLRYNVADSVVMPENDQLPGSCKNFFTALDYVDVSNYEFGITCALIDSPLFEMGTITAEKPWLRSIEPSTTFFSYVLNNYWHTNYKADQEGWIEFRYSMQFHNAFDPVAAFQFARGARTPVLYY